MTSKKICIEVRLIYFMCAPSSHASCLGTLWASVQLTPFKTMLTSAMPLCELKLCEQQEMLESETIYSFEKVNSFGHVDVSTLSDITIETYILFKYLIL